MPQSLIIDWLDENALRAYPLKDSCDFTIPGSTVTLDKLILDANFIYYGTIPTAIKLESIEYAGTFVKFFVTGLSEFVINDITQVSYPHYIRNGEGSLLVVSDLVYELMSITTTTTTPDYGTTTTSSTSSEVTYTTGTTTKISLCDSLLPVMVSNTLPSGQCKASKEWTPAYYAFNGDVISPIWYTPDLTGWLQYKFPELARVAAYTIWPASPSQYGTPYTWLFQASLDGLTWVELDYRYAVSGWQDQTPKTFNIASPGDYYYYRLNVSDSDQPIDISVQGFAIAELDFCSGDVPAVYGNSRQECTRYCPETTSTTTTTPDPLATTTSTTTTTEDPLATTTTSTTTEAGPTTTSTTTTLSGYNPVMLRVKDYRDFNCHTWECGACYDYVSNSTDAPWDGILVHYLSPVAYPLNTWYSNNVDVTPSGPSITSAYSVDGTTLIQAVVFRQLNYGGTYNSYLKIYCAIDSNLNQIELWSGSKSGDVTGVYVRTGGCAAGPTTFEVEEFNTAPTTSTTTISTGSTTSSTTTTPVSTTTSTTTPAATTTTTTTTGNWIQNIQIKDYSDTMLHSPFTCGCLACASSSVPWNGKFEWSTRLAEVAWESDNFTGTYFDDTAYCIEGSKRFHWSNIRRNNSNSGFDLYVYCADSLAPLWQGHKLDGVATSPIGVYLRSPGCCSGLASLEIEEATIAGSTFVMSDVSPSCPSLSYHIPVYYCA